MILMKFNAILDDFNINEIISIATTYIFITNLCWRKLELLCSFQLKKELKKLFLSEKLCVEL
jgi:hypothetical protein